MKTFQYDISVQAATPQEADAKMKALAIILKKLNAQELQKIAEVVSNPIQLAMVKSKLL